MGTMTKITMLAVVACSSIFLGGAFGYEGGIGIVVGVSGFWFSPAMAMIGGLAGFGGFVLAWIAADEIGLI